VCQIRVTGAHAKLVSGFGIPGLKMEGALYVHHCTLSDRFMIRKTSSSPDFQCYKSANFLLAESDSPARLYCCGWIGLDLYIHSTECVKIFNFISIGSFK
jgi:hypothetical protein